MICPICLKKYEPVLERKTDKLVQIEFPNAEKWEREQLMSGICSQKCWDRAFNKTFHECWEESVGIEEEDE